MPKWFLYIIILALLGFILYLTTDVENYFKPEPEPEINIQVSEPVITRSEPATTTEAEEEMPENLLAISGRLVRFEEAPDRGTGELVVYALIDDGTEFISIDMRRVVKPGVSTPENQLGLTLGQTITVHGELIDGVFVAFEVE